MLAKIKDILIIVNKGELEQYKKILPNGNNLGIAFKEQENQMDFEALLLEEILLKDKVAQFW